MLLATSETYASNLNAGAASHPTPQRQWQGLTQRIPSRTSKTAWHSDITDVMWPRGVQQTKYNSVTPSLVDTANLPAPQQHAEFTPIGHFYDS